MSGMDITPIDTALDYTGVRPLAEALYRRVRQRGFVSGQTTPRLQRNILFGEDIPERPRKMPRERTTTLGDPASYRQLATTKRKAGRKTGQISRMLRLLKTVATPLRYVAGRVQDINAANGVYWLSHQTIDVNKDMLPLYVMPIHAIVQGGVAYNTVFAANFMYQLGYDGSVPATAGYFWRAVPGTDPITGLPRQSPRMVLPSRDATVELGRKGMLDWTRLRLCVYGKVNNPTQIRLRLVKFLDEEFCPENWVNKTTGLTGVMPPKVNEYWTSTMKYLLNGHSATWQRASKKNYIKVLKSYTVNLNPIDAGAETAASDPRGHMRHFDLFNRWNRSFDFTTPVTAEPTMADILDINRMRTVADSYSAYLQDPEKGVYWIIDSVQPVRNNVSDVSNPVIAPTAPGVTASFDARMEYNWTKLEPFT